MSGRLRHDTAEDGDVEREAEDGDAVYAKQYGASTETILRHHPLPDPDMEYVVDEDDFIEPESLAVGPLDNRRRTRRQERRDRRQERRKDRRGERDTEGAVVIPLGRPKNPTAVMELGHYFISQSGWILTKKTIRYKHNWKSTPHTVHSHFGKWKVTLPWGIEFKKWTLDLGAIGKYSLRYPWFGTKDIYLPVLLFVNDNDKVKITVFILFGEAHFMYSSIGDCAFRQQVGIR